MTCTLRRKQVKQRSLCFCTCMNLFQDLPAERALVRIRENELQEVQYHAKSQHESSAWFNTTRRSSILWTLMVMQIIKPSCSSRTNVVKCSWTLMMIHRISLAFTGFQCAEMSFFVLISMSPLRSLEGISPCREATLPARPKSLSGDTRILLGSGKYCLC